MKFLLVSSMLLCVAPAFAQSEATIPVTHDPSGTMGLPSAGVGVAVERPVPLSTVKPVPLAPVETPAEMAADQALRKQADEDITSYSQSVADTCDGSFKNAHRLDDDQPAANPPL